MDPPSAAANIASLVETVGLHPGRRVLNSADPDTPSGIEIARTVANHLGHEWTEVLLDDDADPLLGWHPWDRRTPIVLDTTAALALGYRPVGDYRATVPAVIDWLTSTAQLTGGAQLPAGYADDYFVSRFDYELEDVFLGGCHAGTSAERDRRVFRSLAVGHRDRMADSVKLLIVGDGPVTDALTVMVSALKWSVSVTSTAPTIEPDLDAVVITSHHEDVDGPAIRSALGAGVGYVGAMGSRRTQLRRREWLLGEGVSEKDLAVLHAPIGLDIGADQPGEIAVSILAEVVAVRSGRLAAARR